MLDVSKSRYERNFDNSVILVHATTRNGSMSNILRHLNFPFIFDSIDICHLIDFELSLSGKKGLTLKNPFFRWIRSAVKSLEDMKSMVGNPFSNFIYSF